MSDELRAAAEAILANVPVTGESVRACLVAVHAERLARAYLAPIDVVLPCPRCGLLHVDAPEPATGWSNPPHKSHLCHGCRLIWRPADVPTNGVAAVKTRGEKDSVDWDWDAIQETLP